MVELAATLFVIIVLSNFVIGFVNGIGGWGNAGFAVVLLIVAVGLIVLFGIGVRKQWSCRHRLRSDCLCGPLISY